MEKEESKKLTEKSISSMKPCYMFVSKSSSILDEKISNLKKLLRNQINMDTDFNVYYAAEEINSREFLNYCNTPSFFSMRKVAVIKDIDKAGLDFLDALLDFFNENKCKSQETIIVITASKMPFSRKEQDDDKKTKTKGKKTKGKTFNELIEIISSIGIIETLNAPASSSLKKWLHEKAELDGLNFTQQSANRFIENVNFDLNLLKKEYEKINLYMISEKDKNVGVETVNRLVSRVFEMKIFDLVDFIGKRDKNNALEALKSVLYEKKSVKDAGEQPQSGKGMPGLITLLHRMFKAFLLIKTNGQKDMLLAYVRRHLGHAPYMVQRVSDNYFRFSRNYSIEEIIKIFDILNRYDVLLRTSQQDINSGLVLKFISEITDTKLPAQS